MQVWHYKFTINQHDIASSQLTQNWWKLQMTWLNVEQMCRCRHPTLESISTPQAERTSTTVNQNTMHWIKAKNMLILIFNFGVFAGLFKTRIYLNLPTFLRIHHISRKTASCMFRCGVTVLSKSRILHDLCSQLSLFFSFTVWDDFMATASSFKPHQVSLLIIRFHSVKTCAQRACLWLDRYRLFVSVTLLVIEFV